MAHYVTFGSSYGLTKEGVILKAGIGYEGSPVWSTKEGGQKEMAR